VQAQRRIARLLRLLAGDGFVLFHLRQHQVAAADGFLRVKQRRKSHRPLGQSGQQSRFRQVQVLRMLGKVVLGCSLEPVHPAAQIDLVAVECENLLLGEGALDLDGQIRLLDLARGGALRGEKQVARQLHGQCGGALGAAVAADVVPRRPGNAEDVDAPVRFEALVFDGDHSLAQDGRKAVVVDHLAALQRKRAHDAALHVVELGGGRWPVFLQVVDLRQIDRVDQRETGQRACNDRQQKQHRQRKPPASLRRLRGGSA